MINPELRSQGVGGSEVAAIVGLDPRRDSFAVFCEKTGMAPPDPSPPTARMKRGKYLEQGIIKWYADASNQVALWSDETKQHPERSWQVVTPDAFVVDEKTAVAVGGVDAKTSGLGMHDEWGDSGSDIVPERVALQCQWTCSTFTLPWWDVACLMSLDELRIFRIHFDKEVEAILLEQVEYFWTKHVIPRVPPKPGASSATYNALKRMFPKNVENLRPATESEWPLFEALKAAKREFKRAERILNEVSNQVKFCIGDADGLTAGNEKVTWKKDADSTGVDWEKVARELGLRLELVKPVVEWAVKQKAVDTSNGLQLVKKGSVTAKPAMPEWWAESFEALTKGYETVTRQGPRKLWTPRSWNGDE